MGSRRMQFRQARRQGWNELTKISNASKGINRNVAGCTLAFLFQTYFGRIDGQSTALIRPLAIFAQHSHTYNLTQMSVAKLPSESFCYRNWPVDESETHPCPAHSEKVHRSWTHVDRRTTDWDRGKDRTLSCSGHLFRIGHWDGRGESAKNKELSRRRRATSLRFNWMWRSTINHCPFFSRCVCVFLFLSIPFAWWSKTVILEIQVYIHVCRFLRCLIFFSRLNDKYLNKVQFIDRLVCITSTDYFLFNWITQIKETMYNRQRALKSLTIENP